jgi:Na+-translocating ferredoxin:NAD+ oxidoreductase RNF subunit RnfB
MLENMFIPVLILGGLGAVFGVGLSFASKKFAVEVDERIEPVRNALPGANCAACGFSGCDAFAEAVVAGNAQADGCPVGGSAAAAQIAEIMGVEAVEKAPETARVICRGDCNSSVSKYEYSGIVDCAAAAEMYGGPLACSYGCMGLGTCKNACPFDAIVIENGLARILEQKCTACGKCVAVCPKKIIRLVPRTSRVTVACSSLDKGAVVRKNCNVGCIGCRRCAKVCPVDAISFRDGTLADIDPVKCINCGKCIEECPTGAIVGQGL